MLQVYLRRTETEGSWMEVNKGMISDFLMLNRESIEEEAWKKLLSLFEKIRAVEWPDILKQLETEYDIRRELDRAVLSALGYDEAQSDNLLDRLYPVLAREIRLLKKLMESD